MSSMSFCPTTYGGIKYKTFPKAEAANLFLRPAYKYCIPHVFSNQTLSSGLVFNQLQCGNHTYLPKFAHIGMAMGKGFCQLSEQPGFFPVLV